ncbi:MAG: hypothetical protein N3E37_04010 [Candidatus Micrarchaeota archaeon]|nr:hypothetical protein [Candidatus Micrarchaeota archaeon]
MPLPNDLPELLIKKDNPLFKINTISTGVKKLDIILEGGLETSNSYLFYGNLDHIRILLMQLIDFNKDIKIMYLTTDFPYVKVIELAKKMYFEIGHCMFVDMYSIGKQTPRVIYVSSHEIEKLKEVIKTYMLSLEKKFVLIVDNLEGLKQAVGEENLMNLVKFLYVGVKDFDGVVIYISSSNLFSFHQGIDVTFNLTGNEIKNEDLPCEINYKVQESGIEIT